MWAKYPEFIEVNRKSFLSDSSICTPKSLLAHQSIWLGAVTVLKSSSINIKEKKQGRKKFDWRMEYIVVASISCMSRFSRQDRMHFVLTGKHHSGLFQNTQQNWRALLFLLPFRQQPIKTAAIHRWPKHWLADTMSQSQPGKPVQRGDYSHPPATAVEASVQSCRPCQSLTCFQLVALQPDPCCCTWALSSHAVTLYYPIKTKRGERRGKEK